LQHAELPIVLLNLYSFVCWVLDPI
jgi:hypothetical protein